MNDDLKSSFNTLNDAQKGPTFHKDGPLIVIAGACLLYTSPSPRDVEESRMPSSA